MSEKTIPSVDKDTLTWAARVWSALGAVECVGILWIALRYVPEDQNSRDVAGYIEWMSLLPWLNLGEPLQRDIARALSQLRKRLSA